LLPELSDFTGKKVIDAVLNETDTVRLENSIKALYAIIMEKAGETEALTACIKRIYERLIGKSVVTREEELFLRQHALFGADIGLFSFFFFNVLELKNGQAIYTEAGVPHAYIKGNIIECMASSDNVVRAGLTPKFKDVKTLLDIITYGFSKYEVMNSGMNPDVAVYKTPAAEFEISHFEFSAGMGRTVNSFDKPGICLVDRGKISVSWESDGLLETQSYRKGESFFIPACLAEYTVFSHGSASFFSVEIPD
jgi:mannose-6-phosphate isomerase